MKRFCLFSLLAATLVACSPKAEQAAKVYGRFVPERKDDFAWENEYAAFRMYGPALLPENPSNGVDLWLKASPELVVDSFYYREHVLGLPYHINYGKGLDCYKVGHTMGCGGLAVLVEPSCEAASTRETPLYIGGPYSTWEILEQTPERFSFRLHYDSLLVAGKQLQADITITAEAGQLLNRADVVLTGEVEGTLYVGGGIYLHDTLDNLMTCEKCGAIAYAEDALSDKTAAQMNFDYNGSTSQGRSYIAVVTPGSSRQEVLFGNALSLKHYTMGDTLTYYFGACWSEWSSETESFPTDEAWFEAVRTFASNLEY